MPTRFGQAGRSEVYISLPRSSCEFDKIPKSGGHAIFKCAHQGEIGYNMIRISELSIDASEVSADAFVIPMERTLIDTTGGVCCRRFLSQWSKGRDWGDGVESAANSARLFSWNGTNAEPSVVFVNVPIGSDYAANFEEALGCCFANVLKVLSRDAIRIIAIPHFPAPPGIEEGVVARIAISSAICALREKLISSEIVFYCGNEHTVKVYKEAQLRIVGPQSRQ